MFHYNECTISITILATQLRFLWFYRLWVALRILKVTFLPKFKSLGQFPSFDAYHGHFRDVFIILNLMVLTYFYHFLWFHGYSILLEFLRYFGHFVSSKVILSIWIFNGFFFFFWCVFFVNFRGVFNH